MPMYVCVTEDSVYKTKTIQGVSVNRGFPANLAISKTIFYVPLIAVEMASVSTETVIARLVIEVAALHRDFPII